MGEDKGQEERAPQEVREKWGGQVEFLLSCIGYCVGLGNVWRFPYLAYRNGGGAFLIPYLIMLVLCGIPLFMMELSFGQFSGLGPISAWRASPIFKGIGFGMVSVSFLVCIYYNVIIAWSLRYLFASFQSVLPWTRSDGCWTDQNTTETNMTTAMPPTTAVATTAFTTSNVTSNVTVNLTTSTSELYWKHCVLRQSSGIEETGTVLWDLALCLLLAWIVVFVCLAKGVKSTGKVVYFTATFPYIVLIILLIRGVTLEGAEMGIRFYIIPKWEELQNSKVWSDAATQIFYSLGVSFGGLLTFASYNEFKNNIFRDTLIVSLGNCATSVFAGFVIFSVIGHMATELGLEDVSQVADEGPGLAFIAYPAAVALLPIPQLWSVLFFLMLFTLGLDSQFAMVETVTTALIDEYPTYLRKNKTWFTLAVCIVAFLLGLLLVTEGGIYWFNLYEWYSAYFGLLILALVMCLAINWGYGFCFTTRWRFNHDIKLMLGFEPNWYFKITWMFITPGMITFIILYSGINYSPMKLGKYIYPAWAEKLGLCMCFSVCSAIPIYMAVRLVMALIRGDSLRSLIVPSPRWAPSDPDIPYDASTGPINAPEMMKPPTYSQYVDDVVPDPFQGQTLSQL